MKIIIGDDYFHAHGAEWLALGDWLLKEICFCSQSKKIENVLSREMAGKGLFFHIGGTSTRWCDRHIKLHRKAQNSSQRSSILKHFARVTRIGLDKIIIRSLYISLLIMLYSATNAKSRNTCKIEAAAILRTQLLIDSL